MDKQDPSFSWAEKLFVECGRGKDVYVFGAGYNCKAYMENFIKKYKVKGIFDNDKSKTGGQLYGAPIIMGEKIKEIDLKNAVFVVSAFAKFEEIKEELAERGVRYIFSVFLIDETMRATLNYMDLQMLAKFDNFVHANYIIDEILSKMGTLQDVIYGVKKLEKVDFRNVEENALLNLGKKFCSQKKDAEAIEFYLGLYKKNHTYHWIFYLFESLNCEAVIYGVKKLINVELGNAEVAVLQKIRKELCEKRKYREAIELSFLLYKKQPQFIEFFELGENLEYENFQYWVQKLREVELNEKECKRIMAMAENFIKIKKFKEIIELHLILKQKNHGYSEFFQLVEAIDLQVKVEIAKEYHENKEYKKAAEVHLQFLKSAESSLELLDILNNLHKIYSIQKGKTEAVYNKNCERLKKYPYHMRKDFLGSEYLELKALYISDNEYLLYNIKEKKVKGRYKIKEEKDEKRFFQDLKQALLVYNEYNPWNIKYLGDCVRKSEDFGGDNHIYLYYDSFEEYCGHLQVIDFTPYLEDHKFVFIFGEEQLEEYYPMDFKKLYGIEYEKMEMRPVQVKEIKSLCIGTHVTGACGITFVREVMDNHPNLLIVYPNNVFPYLYEYLFHDKTVAEIEQKLKDKEKYIEFKNKILRSMYFAYDPKEIPEFFEQDEKLKILEKMIDLLREYKKPSKAEWLKGFYLAYYYAVRLELNKKAQNKYRGGVLSADKSYGRITPMLYFNPHWIALQENDNKELFLYYSYHYLKDVQNNFQYIYFMFVIRDLAANLGSDFDWHFKMAWDCGHYENFNIGLEAGLALLKRVYVHYDQRDLKETLLKWQEDPNERYIQRYVRMLRFEDLKLQPKATSMSICEFLDLPWADSFMECTCLGEKLYTEEPYGFDSKPVYKKRESLVNTFDYYRFELLSFGIYKNWNYCYKYYDGAIFTKEEIIKMFEIPFKLELLEKNIMKNNSLDKSKKYRKEFMQAVTTWLDEQWIHYLKQDFPLDMLWIKPKYDDVMGQVYK